MLPTMALFAAPGVDLDALDPTTRALAEALARNRDLTVISGRRSAAENEAARGASKSQHLHGRAVDIDASGMSKDERTALIREARALGAGGVGVYDNSLHFDTGAPRAWGPSHRAASLPAWAAPAVGAAPAPAAPSQPAAPAGGPPMDDQQRRMAMALMGMTPQAGQARPQAIAAPVERGGTASTIDPNSVPTAQQIQQRQQAAEAFRLRAQQQPTGTIMGGIASLGAELAAGIERARVGSAAKERQSALAEALGGVANDGLTPDAIRTIASLDPALGAQLLERKMQPPKEGYEMLTAAQVAQMGLPAGAYQRGPGGKVSAVGAPQTSVNVNTGRQDNAYQTELGKGAAKTVNGLVDDGVNAGRDALAVNELQALISDPNMEFGTVPALQQWAKSRLGVNVGGEDKAALFTAIVNRLAPTLRVPGSGATSDMEMRLFMQSLPSLVNTREGNALIAKTMGDMVAYRQAAGDIATMMQLGPENGGVTLADGMKQLRGLANPLGAFNAYAKARDMDEDAARRRLQELEQRAGGGGAPAQTRGLTDEQRIEIIRRQQQQGMR